MWRVPRATHKTVDCTAQRYRAAHSVGAAALARCAPGAHAPAMHGAHCVGHVRSAAPTPTPRCRYRYRSCATSGAAHTIAAHRWQRVLSRYPGHAHRSLLRLMPLAHLPSSEYSCIGSATLGINGARPSRILCQNRAVIAHWSRHEAWMAHVHRSSVLRRPATRHPAPPAPPSRGGLCTHCGDASRATTLVDHLHLA